MKLKSRKAIIIILIITAFAWPVLLFAVEREKDWLVTEEAIIYDQAVSSNVDSAPGYYFVPGNAFTDNNDTFYGANVLLQDKDGNAIAGHNGCVFFDQTGSSKLVSEEVVMYSGGLPISSDSACLLVNLGGDNMLKGNIYSGRAIDSQFLLHEGIAISGDQSREDLTERLSDYDIDDQSTARWNNDQEYKNIFMRANIMKWRDQRATDFNNNLTNDFHLNPEGLNNLGSSTSRPSDQKYPSGRTWYHNGDLRIGGTNPNSAIQFKGRGTIIVEGNLTIDARKLIGFSANDSDSLGFIVLPNGANSGNVEITSNVKELKASFFVPGNMNDVVDPLTGLPSSGLFIIHGGGSESLTVKGSIVANGIDMRETRPAQEGGFSIKIEYDGNITQNPPPAFTREMIASMREEAP